MAILSPIIPMPQALADPPAESAHIRSERQVSSLRISDNQVLIETATLSAIIVDGFLISLKSKFSGEEFISGFDRDGYSALELVYPRSELVGIHGKIYGSINLRQISDTRVEVVFHGWHGDGIVAISTDDTTGDLIIEPSAYSSRPEVLACRWNMPGLNHDLQLVAPLFQGIKLRLDDPLIRDSRWPWPMQWEAGLAILQSVNGGFFIHTRDKDYTYKALKTGSANDPFMIGLDTEAYGPLDNNLAAGGLSWRINVFEGSWQVPVFKYREWLWDTYELRNEENSRNPWIHDIRFAISWCPGDMAILEALAKKIEPSKVLLHYPDWRTDLYDQNYPNYVSSSNGRSFIQKCREMGFHVMPHFNSIDMDPTHPVYQMIRDFQYRSIENRQIQGWSWVEGRAIGVPESNESRMHNRDKNVMIKVHPGLSLWRSILGENILKASQDLELDCVFIDVTLVTQNLHNCLVECLTSTEGMKRLITHISQLGRGLVVGGEGLNEITMQGLSFGQVHLFRSWQTSTEGLERTGGCNLNQLLFGKLCRTIGYSGLSGRNEDEALRMKIHMDHGCIPTVTIDSPEEINNPNDAVKRMLEIANG